MKMKILKTLIMFVLMCYLLLIFSFRINGATENSIRAYNIAGQALFTLVRGIIQGNVKSIKDVAKSLLFGSISGYGFYESKRLVGKGHITSGVLLANLSASLSENVSMGMHPLAYLGYTIGPFRFMVASPFAKNPRAIFNVITSSRKAAYLVKSLKKSDRISFRGGLLTFSAREYYINALGWTYGVYPTVMENSPEWVFRHEVIHAIQDIQIMSVSPEPYIFLKSSEKRNILPFRFSGLHIDILNLANTKFAGSWSYKNQWYEIEAYFFAHREIDKQ